MKAAAFEYARPEDVAGAVRALAQAQGEAKLLAGGQSLGPMLNLRLARPRLLVDIARIASLRSIDGANGTIRIGAAVTHSMLEDAGDRLAGGAMIAAVARDIAYRAIRNRGTIGGSLAHADPAADWPLAAAVLGATIHVRGLNGARAVAADRFMLGAFTTALAEDELIEAVEFPRLGQRARWGYYKFCKKTGEFPDASAAAVFDPDRGVARVFVGALNGAPRPLEELARSVAQQGASAITSAAADRALAEAVPDLDALARRMHASAVVRAIRQAVGEAPAPRTPPVDPRGPRAA